MYLPEAFQKKMKAILGEEYDDFLAGFEKPRHYGLRVNTAKITVEEFKELVPFHLTQIPWVENGFYYEEEDAPTRHPYYYAGLYYIQEPSAMTTASRLPVGPGERVLDLCAAPGGKATELGAKLFGEGLLVANDISASRVKALLKNIEVMGIPNSFLLNEVPAKIAEQFPAYFDKILVDAPCSGEGMFRKDENARNEWSPDHVKQCAGLQDGILDCAAAMLKGGGRIVYSTCTFSPEENEQSIARFLERHPEFSVVQPELAKYFSAGHPEWADGNEELKKTVRIWPHLADGEGHFLALLVKGERSWDAVERTENADGKKNSKKGGRKNGRAKEDAALTEAVAAFRAFEKENLKDMEHLENGKKFLMFGENLYLVPEVMPGLMGLKVLRPGLHLGSAKKDRFEPSHALALALKKSDVRQSVEVGSEDLALRYLRGETLRAEDLEEPNIPAKGWVLVTTGGMSLGFAKAAGGMLKNHYPKGLRIQGG